VPQRAIKNLDDLMDGGVHERFNLALDQVLNNVFDPNTKAKAVRKITLTFNIISNDRRDAAEFVSDVNVKLAPPAPLTQTVFLAKADDGTVTATEITNQVKGQLGMDGSEVIPKTVEFKPKLVERGNE
jgi:hypothetical protein